MKVTRVIKQVLYEKEKKEYKGLNIYYKIDIIIKETEEDMEQMNQAGTASSRTASSS